MVAVVVDGGTIAALSAIFIVGFGFGQRWGASQWGPMSGCVRCVVRGGRWSARSLRVKRVGREAGQLGVQHLHPPAVDLRDDADGLCMELTHECAVFGVEDVVFAHDSARYCSFGPAGEPVRTSTLHEMFRR